jgi:hypothetical protein
MLEHWAEQKRLVVRNFHFYQLGPQHFLLLVHFLVLAVLVFATELPMVEYISREKTF